MSPIRRDVVNGITIYKLIPEFSATQALREYDRVGNGTNRGWGYTIFTRLRPNLPPSWEPLVAHLVNRAIPRNAYTSLVIIFEKSGRRFALTSGYGYANVRAYSVGDFGVEIAKKTLNPNALSHLHQKVPTGNVYGLSRLLRGRYMPASDHVNHRSVLKSLKGRVLDAGLGATLEGRTSLALSGKKNFDDVVDFLERLVRVEDSEGYSVQIKGLDEVSGNLKYELEGNIAEKVNSEDFNDVMLGYDDDLIFRNCETLQIGREETRYPLDHTQEIMSAAKRLRPDNPSGIQVVGFDENNQEVFEGRRLIDLVEGELDHGGEKYFRIDRKWYKTNQDYRNQIEEDFLKIEKLDNYFQGWSRSGAGYIDEGNFLISQVNAHRVLAHTQKFSGVEFADMIDNQSSFLIHVKKGKGAFLRNLFAQGFVSASLFRGDQSFQGAVRRRFGVNHSQKYTVLFAIFPEGEQRINSVFTLFAKVDFLERYDVLKGMGFDVKYTLINPA